jgi:toxin ParE1/3/4
MRPLLWARSAERDLMSIIQFIAERDPIAAHRLGTEIERSTLFLSEYPELYKVSERMPECREIVISPNYLLIYQIRPNHVKSLRVLHARQQFP